MNVSMYRIFKTLYALYCCGDNSKDSTFIIFMFTTKLFMRYLNDSNLNTYISKLVMRNYHVCKKCLCDTYFTH